LRQFEIWWAELPKTAERRPVLPLSRDGLPKPCVANCDNLRTVARQSLLERISKLPARRFAEVKRAVGYAFGWDELIDIVS
jgi:mRNA-degrading endonuclease toxin of MazEF toxin-antitoxin module